MRVVVTVVSLAALLLATTGCKGTGGDPGPGVSAIDVNGAKFEIADAAVASNCLSMAFAVRGFRPPPGVDPQAYFPPAKSIDIQVLTHGGELGARALGGGGGGGGNQEDGRIWMQHRMLYSLEGSVPEGEVVTLDVTVVLDDDFERAEPLRYHISVVAGPGGGTCP
jgi:hypothetical protein